MSFRKIRATLDLAVDARLIPKIFDARFSSSTLDIATLDLEVDCNKNILGELNKIKHIEHLINSEGQNYSSIRVGR